MKPINLLLSELHIDNAIESWLINCLYFFVVDDDNPIHDDHCKFTFTTSLHS